MLITFSGLDGSGKSTLIQAVTAALEESQTSVVVRHMNYDVGLFPLLNVIWRRLQRARSTGHPRPPATSPGQTSRWRRLRSAIVWNKPCRRLVYLADLLIFACYRFRIEWLGGRVLIMDRYFYDTLVDVATPHSWGWARLLARITPTPNLPVWLDCTPEEAFARKGEFSVDYLTRRSLAYKRVFGWIPTAMVLDNTDLARSTGQITRRVAQALGRAEEPRPTEARPPRATDRPHPGRS
jgi:thymidylate kinase